MAQSGCNVYCRLPLVWHGLEAVPHAAATCRRTCTAAEQQLCWEEWWGGGGVVALAAYNYGRVLSSADHRQSEIAQFLSVSNIHGCDSSTCVDKQIDIFLLPSISTCNNENPSKWRCFAEGNPSKWSCFEGSPSKWSCFEGSPSKWSCFEGSPSKPSCFQGNLSK